MNIMTKSKFARLDKKDALRGLGLGVLQVILVKTSEMLFTEGLEFLTWQFLVGIALAGALAYIAKNFITNSQDKLLRKEPEATKM